MTFFTFNEWLEKNGINYENAHLVRHSTEIGLGTWARGIDHFDHEASYQSYDKGDPYLGADLIFQFVPNGGSSVLYVGTHRVLAYWDKHDDPDRVPRLAMSNAKPDARGYDLERVTEGPLADMVGRLVIDWGKAARAWKQLPKNQDKEILEVFRQKQDPPFPGYDGIRFLAQEISGFPKAWQDALSYVGGVYLMVSPEGEQYVGAAYGGGGFMQRFWAYADGGDGGNVKLKDRDTGQFQISILEIADTTKDQYIRGREKAWKDKLGSRVHGLNEN